MSILDTISIVEPSYRVREENSFPSLINSGGHMVSFKNPTTFTVSTSNDSILYNSAMDIVQPVDVYGDRVNFSFPSRPIYTKKMFWEGASHSYTGNGSQDSSYGFNIFGTYIGIKKNIAGNLKLRLLFSSNSIMNGYVKSYNNNIIVFSYTELPNIFTEKDSSSNNRFSVSDCSRVALSTLGQNTSTLSFYSGTITSQEKYSEIYGNMVLHNYQDKEISIDVSENGTLSNDTIESIQTISFDNNTISVNYLGDFTKDQSTKVLTSVSGYPSEEDYGVSSYIYLQKDFSNEYSCRLPVFDINMAYEYSFFVVRMTRKSNASFLCPYGFSLGAMVV